MSVGPRLRRTTYVARYGKRSLWATPASGSVLHSLWNRATHAWSRSDCDGWGGEGHAARTETVVVRDRDRHEGGADMTRIIGAPRSRRRTWLFLSTIAPALAVAVLFIPSALAVHDEAFQLEGHLADRRLRVGRWSQGPQHHDQGREHRLRPERQLDLHRRQQGHQGHRQ